LPALLPSWRFFDTIGPSPRIQYALLRSENDSSQQWYEFRPRSKHVSFGQMLTRMVWNPNWNESLFLTSCAERLRENATFHSENEIMRCIIADFKAHLLSSNQEDANFIQFRLLFIERQKNKFEHNVTFYSQLKELPKREFSDS